MLLYFVGFTIITLKRRIKMYSYGKENLKNVCETGKELLILIRVLFIPSLSLMIVSYFAHSITGSDAIIKFIDFGLTGVEISFVAGILVLFLMTFTFVVMELFRIAHGS